MWMVFTFVSLGLLFWRDRKILIYATLGVVISAAYFLVVTRVVMPGLIPGRGYFHMNYHIIDNSATGAIKLLFTDPYRIIQAFFLNVTPYASADYIKAEFYTFFLLGGALFILRRPEFLIVVTPIVMMKVFNDSDGKWGVYGHYSIELATYIGLAAVYSLRNMRASRAFWIALIFTVSASAITIYGFDHRRLFWYDPATANPLSAKHWQREFDVAKMHRTLKKWRPDENATLSAHYSLIPHLAERDNIYQWPEVRDSKYIFVLRNMPNATYPLSAETYVLEVHKYINNPEWKVIEDGNHLTIFERVEDLER